MATPANLNEQTGPKAPAKWTVMIYMAAGDGADLDAHAVADLREMERAAVGPDVNVVVQMNRFWPARPQRYRILDKEARLVRADIVDGEPLDDADVGKKAFTTPDGANMGLGATLANFMAWSKTHYEAEHYFLVLWGHAYGLGFGRDHGEAMTLADLKEALRTFRDGLPKAADGSRPQLDLLGANACAFSYAEAACELSEHVRCLVASEIAVPFAGWPYEAILGRLSRVLNARTAGGLTPEQLGTLVADRYVGQFSGSRGEERVAMSVLDLTRVDALQQKVTALTTALTGIVDSTDKRAAERRAQIRAVFLSTAGGDVRPMLDLYDLAQRLEALCKDLTVLEAAATSDVHAAIGTLSRAATALMSFIRPDLHPDEEGRTGTPFVLCRRTHAELTDLHGVGVFAPFVTDERDLKRLGLDAGTKETGRDAYMGLSFPKTTGWGTMVYDTLRSMLPTDVVTGVEGSGATNRADRSGVTQLLTSVDAVFDVLDRRIDAASVKLLANVPDAGAAGQGVAIEAGALNLLASLRLVRHAEVDDMFVRQPAETAKGATGGTGMARPFGTGPSTGTTEQATHIARQFGGLESAIVEAQRAVRRALTNGTFGLGPGLGAARDKEGLLGAARDKEGLLGAARDKEGLLGAARDKEGLLGAARDKEGLLGAARDKEGLLGAARDKEGLLGVLALALSEAQSTPAAIVASLFGDVGRAMQALEVAVADAETIAAKAVLAPVGAHGFEPLANVALAKPRLERALEVVKEASGVLRETVRCVASDPAYGIGPGPQALTLDDRRELAHAGGLNGRRLALI